MRQRLLRQTNKRQDPHHNCTILKPRTLCRERYDCVRTVRNDRYVYIRNYMPVALLSDASPSACIAAAESIAAFGNDAKAAIDRLVELADPAKHGPYVAMQALASIDALGQKAKPWKDAIAALPTAAPGTDARVREEYIKRLRESISRSIT